MCILFNKTVTIQFFVSKICIQREIRDYQFIVDFVKISADLTFCLIGSFIGGKRGDYQNCSVLYCIRQLCIIISTLR